MTPEQQDLAIAKLCEGKHLVYEERGRIFCCETCERIYPSQDIEVMAEIIKELILPDRERSGKFLLHLSRIIEQNWLKKQMWEMVIRCMTASAQEQAEALLRTFNLWDDATQKTTT